MKRFVGIARNEAILHFEALKNTCVYACMHEPVFK